MLRKSFSPNSLAAVGEIQGHSEGLGRSSAKDPSRLMEAAMKKRVIADGLDMSARASCRATWQPLARDITLVICRYE